MNQIWNNNETHIAYVFARPLPSSFYSVCLVTMNRTTRSDEVINIRMYIYVKFFRQTRNLEHVRRLDYNVELLSPIHNIIFIRTYKHNNTIYYMFLARRKIKLTNHFGIYIYCIYGYQIGNTSNIDDAQVIQVVTPMRT